MIEISYKTENVIYFEMKGHAKYAPLNKDIVCASASSIVITSLNAISKFIAKDDYKLVEDDGFLNVEIYNLKNEIKIIFNNMIETLEELALQFPKHIKLLK